MAPTPMLSGVVDDNTILSNQRIIDMDDVIAELEPDEAPLTTLLMKVGKRAAFSQKVEWLEDELHPRYTTASGSFTNVATTVNVAASTGVYFKANDVIRDELTGENMLVTAVAADALTVVRGIGSVVGTASSGAADGIIRVSNASLEGALLGTLKQTKKVANFNYCQITRTPFGFTNTLIQSKLYGQSNVLGYEAQKKMIEHKREIEQTLFLGRRNLITSGANPQAFCGGITDYITTNITTIGGNLTQVNFENFLRNASRFGSNNKVLIAAPLIMSALSSFPLGRLAPPDASATKDWGVSLRTYRAGNGFQIDIIEHRDWMDYTTTSPGLGGSAFLLDMDSLILCPLRDTKLMPNRQANDEDSEKQEVLTEYGFRFKHERRHAWLRGVTGF